MKKPIQIGDDLSGDDADWEQTRRMIASTSSLAEASDLLEEETRIYRRRRQNENGRSKRQRPSEDDTEHFTRD